MWYCQLLLEQARVKVLSCYNLKPVHSCRKIFFKSINLSFVLFYLPLLSTYVKKERKRELDLGTVSSGSLQLPTLVVPFQTVYILSPHWQRRLEAVIRNSDHRCVKSVSGTLEQFSTVSVWILPVSSPPKYGWSAVNGEFAVLNLWREFFRR